MTGSAATTAYEIHIRAINETMAPMRAITAEFNKVMGAARGLNTVSVQGAAAHVQFAHSIGTHMRVLNTHFQQANAGLSQMRNSVSAFLPAIGALGAGGSLVGLFALTKAVADSSLAMSGMQAKLGPVNAVMLPGLAMQAKMSGVPVEALGAGLVKLEKNLATSSMGDNKKAAALFKHLNIAMKDSAGHIRHMSALLPELAEAFQKTEDPEMRLAMAQALMGKSGAELIPILSQGPEVMKAYMEAAAKFKYAPTGEEVKGLKDYSKAMIEFDASMGAFRKELGSKLAPVFAPLIEAMTQWIQMNRDWIATEIAEKVKVLADFCKMLFNRLDQVQWEALKKKFNEWGDALRPIGEYLKNGWIWAGAFTLVMGAPFIAGIAGAVVVVGQLGAAMRVLTLLAVAHPLLLLATALAAAIYLVWQNWDRVVQAFHASMDWIINGLEKILRLIHATSFRSLTEGAVDPDAPPGTAPLPAPRALPQLYSPGSNTGGGAPSPSGQLTVQVEFANTPPGTKVITQGSGLAASPIVDVGYANPMGDLF